MPPPSRRSVYAFGPPSSPPPVAADTEGSGGILGTGIGPDINFGLGQLFDEIGQGVTGLVRFALPDAIPAWANPFGGDVDIAPGGPGAGDIGRGLLTSLAGTASTVNEVLNPADNLIGSPVEHIIEGLPAQLFGEEYRGQGIVDRIEERGLLPALVEDIGNVALASGAVTGTVRAAGAGARTVGATNTAARLAATRLRLLDNPIIQATQHPYLTAGRAVRNRFLQPAARAVELADGIAPTVPDDGVPTETFAPIDFLAAELGDTGVDYGRVKVDMAEHAARAEQYDAMPVDDATAHPAYERFVEETDEQYRRAVEDLGVTFEFVDDAEPYASAAEMVEDLRNRRLKVAKTSGDAHPYLTPEQNDRFRAVHDLFGHGGTGRAFDRHGEEAAFLAHASMYSPEAVPALATETRGQNASLIASGEFGPQKVGLLPNELADPAGAVARFQRLAPPDPADLIEAPTVGSGTRFLADIERRLAARDTARKLREETRIADTERSIAARSPAVRQSVAIARDHLIDAARSKGRIMTRREASLIVGDEVFARLGGIKALEEQFPQLGRETFERLGIRQRTIPEDLQTPEVLAALDEATGSWAEQKAQTREILAQGRVGTRGLEAEDVTAPALTKRQQRMLKAADRKLRRATSDVLARKIAREDRSRRDFITAQEDKLARVAERISLLDDRAARAVEAFDHSRALTPRAWKTPEALRRTAEEIVESTLRDGGASFDPHAARFVVPGRDPGFAVALVPGTASKVWANELTPEHVMEVVRAYQDIYQHPGTVIGTWLDDSGMVHIDPAEIVTDLDEALVRGGARQQEAIYDMAGDRSWDVPLKDRPDIAQHFLTRNRGLRRLSAQLREVSKHGSFTPEDANLMIAEQARMAVRAWELGRIKHPDDFFGQVLREYQAAKKRSARPGALAQLVLDRDITTPEAQRAVWAEVESRVKDLDHALGWYHRSHDTIERLFRKQKPITLLDGKTTINPADLLYQLIAVTSVQAAPRDNLAHAFRAIVNIGDIDPQVFDDAVRSIKDVLAERKTLEEAFAGETKKARTAAVDPVRKRQAALGEEVTKRLTGVSQVPVSRQYVMEILQGHTMDRWTPEYIAQANDDFGRLSAPDRAKALAFLEEHMPETLARVGEEQAVREFWSRAGRAKLLSFWENLARPGDSLSVTMDMWMERLFGFEFEQGGGPSWLRWADHVRDMADELSQSIGRKVMPHEVQGALWVFAKTEVTRLQVGHFLAFAEDALDEVRAGRPLDDADPILAWLDEAAAPYLDEASRVETKRRVMDPDGTVAQEPAHFMPGGKAERQKTLQLIEKRRVKWLAAREQVNASLSVGDVDRAVRHLSRFMDDMTTKAPRSLGLLDDVGGGDFADIWTNPDYHSKSFREAAESLGRRFKGVELGQLPGEALLQAFKDKVLGEFVPLDDGTKGIIRIFETGNFQTLVHENGHLLRRLIDGAQLRAVERAYGVTDGTWSVKAEERFANDFVAWHRGASAPKGMEGTFARVRQALSDVWEMVRGTFQGRRVHPDVAAVFDDWLDPEVRPLDDGIPGLSTAPETGTMRQRAARPPKLPQPPAGTRQFYESGRKGQQALNELETVAARRRQLEATKAKIEATIADVREVLDTGRLPSQIEQRSLIEQARTIGQKVRAEQGVPSVKRTPARWQPLWDAVLKIGKEAEGNPELAAVLDDLPRTLQEVQALATDAGFDPVHVRDFTPAQVRRLVFGNMRLGMGGRDGVVHEVQAGTRKQRTGVLTKRGAVDRSVEALLAASVEATNEVRTNAVIDWVEKNAARQLPAGTPVPEGWVPWSPTRTFLLTGHELSEDALRSIDTALDETTIVPAGVVTQLKRYSKDYEHWAYRAIAKVTSPWRTLVLTMSPGWYVRNFVGNLMMASAEGVRLQDWKAAWRSYRSADELGPFADLPFVQTGGLARDAGVLADNTVIPRAGIGEAITEDGWRGAVEHAKRRAVRVNEVVDEFARAAVYHRSLNQLNMSPHEAWQRANEAMVDYAALSPFERQAVRSVLPFYAWQKGILKVTLNQAIDHPARTGLIMLLGRMNEEYIADRFGLDPEDVPSYYTHLIGDRNVRSYNPFSDSSEILTPEGIVRSLNPFLEVALRKGLGAPEFFPESYRLGYFGTPEADVDVPGELANLLTRSPGGRILGGDAGPTQAVGLGTVDPAALRSRFLRARTQLRGIPNPETGQGEPQPFFLPPRARAAG